ncbi:hypothetical protein BRADI_2g06836v3 [Brachypodium distachyon]|uniref:Secreted protein n=1 Tax=Brachypodium distachyon TaxID=15368 RepID=A0A0Q3ISA2_BRADI|nr:hypothetical protein BRADI_2g06836v3 [Brachypodium distachyon]
MARLLTVSVLLRHLDLNAVWHGARCRKPSAPFSFFERMNLGIWSSFNFCHAWILEAPDEAEVSCL